MPVKSLVFQAISDAVASADTMDVVFIRHGQSEANAAEVSIRAVVNTSNSVHLFDVCVLAE